MRRIYCEGIRVVRMPMKKRGERLNMNVNAERTPQILITRRVKRISSDIAVVGVPNDRKNGHGEGDDMSEMPMKYGSVIMMVFRRSSIR